MLKDWTGHLPASDVMKE